MPINATRRTGVVAPPQPAKGRIEIKLQSSDPGVKMSQSGDTITFSGTSMGPKPKMSGNDVLWVENRQYSIELDRSKWPSFDRDPDYSRKNDWYFKHMFTVDTSKGWSAKQCAQRLADKVNAAGTYTATVTAGPNGTAKLKLTPAS